MNLLKDDIVDDEASETSEVFESDEEEEKNDVDDLEEDKVEIDDDDSTSESGDEDTDDDDDNEDNIVDEVPVLLNKQRYIDDDEGDSDNDSDNDDDSEYEDENCLQKFNDTVKKNLISEFHPEMMEHNETEVELMSTVVRNSNGVIIDELHKSVPFITKYEKARIIGERSRQINSGATPFINVNIDVIDGYLIAVEEFNKKKIPFIIKRPMPSGKCEYWRLSDLEIL